VKYDGFRALAYLEDGTVRLVSRKGNTYRSFPALCQSLAVCLSVNDAVLDGEIVYLGPDGKPQLSGACRATLGQICCQECLSRAHASTTLAKTESSKAAPGCPPGLR
jgi:hypothetical protein